MVTNVNYVVTIQRPTAVNQTATGYFTSATDFNLILAKNTIFEIYLITDDGLKLIKEVSINGRINTLKCFRLKNMNKDLIFILTDKYHGMILDFQKTESGAFDIVTVSHGSLKDSARSPSIHPPLCTIDTEHNLILLRTVDGMIKLIHLENLISNNFECYNIRIDEVHIIDMKFLSGHDRPTFVVLASSNGDIYHRTRDFVEKFHLHCYQIDGTDFEFTLLPWKENIRLSEANLVTPVGRDNFSCLVFGRFQIGFYRQGEAPILLESSLFDENTIINSFCPMDKSDQCYLVSARGKLYQLTLQSERESVETSLKLEYLGETSAGHSLVFLENRFVFVGSRCADSQLIRLNTEEKHPQITIEHIESYSNSGPIIDMSIIDLERENRQLVTCSGDERDGSLRFIRTGIGIHELASIDLRNIKGIWSLKVNSEYDNHFVVAFFDQTRSFQLQNDEIEEVELMAFDYQHQTLCCANVRSNQYLQITTHSIRLIGNDGRDLLFEWKKEAKEITVATCNLHQCLCATGNELFYFEITDKTLNLINQSTLPHNIACLDITPWNPNDKNTDLCVVGLWTQISVWLCRLPTLEVLHKEPLTSDTLPRSAVIISFDQQAYVIISLADGPIVYYFLNTEKGFLYERRKVPLGTKPTTLTFCQHPDLSTTKNVSSSSNRVLLACSDRPTVISSCNGKLVFSAVNLREIICMCSFDSEFYGSSLTLVTDAGVILGRINDLQKLHVRSLPMGEAPRRIALIEQEKVFVVLTQTTKNGTQSEFNSSISQQAQHKLMCPTEIQSLKATSPNHIRSSIVILDQYTFEAHSVVQLSDGEEANCVCLVNFKEDPSNLYVAVGTGIQSDTDDRFDRCRIILFRYKNGQTMMITETQVNSIPHQMTEYHGRLLASIGNTIHLYSLSTQPEKLVLLCSPFIGYIESFQLKIKDDFILFGDLMHSATILRFNFDEKKFEKIAYNPRPLWTTSCEFFDDDTFLSTTDSGDLVCSRKNSESTKEKERKMLQETGLWHLGEQINVLRRGYLIAPQTIETDISLDTCILMGAISGYIGLVFQLPKSIAPLLISLEKLLATQLTSVGKIEHFDWRRFDSETRSAESSGFIDGDFIEKFLDLSRTAQLELVKDLKDENNQPLNTTVEELVKVIEDLSRLH